MCVRVGKNNIKFFVVHEKVSVSNEYQIFLKEHIATKRVLAVQVFNCAREVIRLPSDSLAFSLAIKIVTRNACEETELKFVRGRDRGKSELRVQKRRGSQRTALK